MRGCEILANDATAPGHIIMLRRIWDRCVLLYSVIMNVLGIAVVPPFALAHLAHDRKAIAFSPYADLLWMETPTADLQHATDFAQGVHARYPHAMLAYNQSPSFNWDLTNMTDSQLIQWTQKLSQLGYVWQFITLAGFHVNGFSIEKFARCYQKEGVLAYIRDIQRQERLQDSTLLTHQKWSGAQVLDTCLHLITQGQNVTQSLQNSTELQFTEK